MQLNTHAETGTPVGPVEFIETLREIKDGALLNQTTKNITFFVNVGRLYAGCKCTMKMWSSISYRDILWSTSSLRAIIPHGLKAADQGVGATNE